MKEQVYTYFWSGIYSQWYIRSFIVDSIEFNCAEQYMMFRKAMLFNDVETANLILDSKDPRGQKRLGRLVKGYSESVWVSNREDIVYEGNLAKFTQNPDLRAKLIRTYPSILVESSPYDSIWGVGLHKTDPDILDPMKWKGLNLLGNILTRLRNNLMQ